MSHNAEIDAVARWLASHDPDPCDPVDYDASGYYRAFAAALLASGWRVTPPAMTEETP